MKKNSFLMCLLFCFFGMMDLYGFYYDPSGQVSSIPSSSSNDTQMVITYNKPNQTSYYAVDATKKETASKEAVEMVFKELSDAQKDTAYQKLHMDKAEEAYLGFQKLYDDIKADAQNAREIAQNDRSEEAYITLKVAEEKEKEVNKAKVELDEKYTDFKKYQGYYLAAQEYEATKQEEYDKLVYDEKKALEYRITVENADKEYTSSFFDFEESSKKLCLMKEKMNKANPAEKQEYFQEFLAIDSDYKEKLKNFETKTAGFRDAAKELGEYYISTGYVGDPVLIGTGDFYLKCEDFIAQDFLDKFTVKRELCSDLFSDSFGVCWTCSLDSRIVRCVFQSYDEQKTLLLEAIETCKKMEHSFDEYNLLYPDLPREETKELVEYAKINREKYESELADVNKLIEMRNSLLEKDKYCLYGRYSNLESVYGFEEQLIFLDENGQDYYFQYDNGKWIPFADILKSKIQIYNLNQNNEHSNSKDCSGGYEVCYLEGSRIIYNQYGILTKKIDKNGNETIYKNQNGLINEVILKTGEHIQIERNSLNLITSINGPVSGKATYSYSGNKLLTVKDNQNNRTEYIYNDNKLYRIKKADGSIIQLNWAFDNYLKKYVCSKVIAENGSFESFSYDFSNRKVVHTTNNGKNELYELNEFGYPIYIKDSYGNETFFTTNKQGLITSAKFSNGPKKYFTYDSLFRPIKIQTESGGVYSAEYKGNVIECITDPDGFNSRYVYDSKGNVIEQYLNGELITTISYYPTGLIKTLTDEEKSISYEYNKYGSITNQKLQKKNGKSKEWKIQYDMQNRIKKIEDENGDITTMAYGSEMQTEQNSRIKKNIYYDSRNRVVKEETFDLINGTKKKKEIVYDNGNVVKILIDGNLYEDFTYSNDNELTSHTKYSLGGNISSEGIKEKFIFVKNYVSEYSKQPVKNTKDELFSIADKKISQKYNFSTVSGNKVVKFTNEMGLESTATYNAYGNVISETFPNGYNVKTVYSKAGRIKQQIDSERKIWDYVYKNDGSYDIVLSTPNGIICKSEFDRSGKLIRCKDIVNGNSYFEYDGEFCSLERTSNYERKMEYDSYGRKILDSCNSLKNGKIVEDYRIVYDDLERKISLFVGKSISSFYECKLDGFGRIIQVFDKNGKTEYAYDSLDRVICKTDGYGRKTYFEYDANNQVNYVLFPDRSELLINHDVNGKITRVEQNGKILRTTDYDTDNRKASFVDMFGTQFDYFYGKDGVITKKVISKSGEYVYSKNDFASEIENFSDSSTYIERNVLGKVVRLRNENSDFLYEYDLLQNLKCVQDFLSGSKVLYEYDNFGRCVSQSVDGCDNYFTYDLCGNVNSILDGYKNVLVSFEYDLLNRVCSKQYWNGIQENITYNENSLVETKVVKDEFGQLLYCELLLYDSKNRLEYKFNETGSCIHYTYKQNGQLHSIEYPLEKSLCTYNLQEAFDCGYPIEQEIKGSLLYINSETLSEVNRLLQKTNLDIRNRILNYETVWKEEFEYTKKGSVASVNNPIGKILFTYDNENRIQEKFYENFPDNKMTFKWSKEGNLVQINGVFSFIEMAYNQHNRISQVNYINRENNIRQIVNYEYDGLNRRILEYDDANAIAYMYEGFSTNVISKFSVFRSGDKNNYVPISDSLYAEESSDLSTQQSHNNYRYIDDSSYSAFGSQKSFQTLPTVTKIDSTNVVSISLGGENAISINGDECKLMLSDFECRGKLEVYGNSNSTNRKYNFIQKDDFETDYTSGYNLLTQIQDFGYRDYIPTIKSFTSEDPMKDGINWYSYCSGDCVNYYDEAGYIMMEQFSKGKMTDPWHESVGLGNSDTEFICKAGCFLASDSNTLYSMSYHGIELPEQILDISIEGLNSEKQLFSGPLILRNKVESELFTYETAEHNVSYSYITVNESIDVKEVLYNIQASPYKEFVNIIINIKDDFPEVGPTHMVGISATPNEKGVFTEIVSSSKNDERRLSLNPSVYCAKNVVAIQIVTVKNKNCAS